MSRPISEEKFKRIKLLHNKLSTQELASLGIYHPTVKTVLSYKNYSEYTKKLKEVHHKAGIKAAKRNKQLHGKDFFQNIGLLGGKKSRGGGFASMPKEKVREAGRKGGSSTRKSVR